MGSSWPCRKAPARFVVNRPGPFERIACCRRGAGSVGGAGPAERGRVDGASSGRGVSRCDRCWGRGGLVGAAHGTRAGVADQPGARRLVVCDVSAGPRSGAGPVVAGWAVPGSDAGGELRGGAAGRRGFSGLAGGSSRRLLAATPLLLLAQLALLPLFLLLFLGAGLADVVQTGAAPTAQWSRPARRPGPFPAGPGGTGA